MSIQLQPLSAQLQDLFFRGVAMTTDGVPDDWRISDDLWMEIVPHLPVHVNTHRFGGGRPRVPDRVCMDAIFFVLRTGCQWKALDATKFCPGSTAHDRFQEWVADGVFLALWKSGLLEYDCLKGIEWRWLSMDGCMTKAPLGGKKNRQKSYRSGQEGRQTQRAGRWPRHPVGLGRRRGQPSGYENGQRNSGEHPRRVPRAEHAGATEPLSGQSIRRR
jgi:putative transposase